MFAFAIILCFIAAGIPTGNSQPPINQTLEFGYLNPLHGLQLKKYTAKFNEKGLVEIGISTESDVGDAKKSALEYIKGLVEQTGPMQYFAYILPTKAGQERVEKKIELKNPNIFAGPILVCDYTECPDEKEYLEQ